MVEVTNGGSNSSHHDKYLDILSLLHAYVRLAFRYAIVRPANRDWACQTERCQTLSNKTIVRTEIQ